MYAAERVNIYNHINYRYTSGCDFVAVVCDYSLMFCATTTLYEMTFVVSSLANRVVSCLCLLALVSVDSEVTSLADLSTSSMVEVLATEEICHEAYERERAFHFSSTPYGDVAERNRYRSRNSRCSVRLRTR